MPANNPVCIGGTTSLMVIPTALTVVKGAPGYLHRVLLTTVNGGNDILIYDNASAASGNIIGIVPAATAKGAMLVFEMNASNGITIAATAGAAQITIGYD
jgi:hypothetical protein